MSETPCRDIAPGEWVASLVAARDEGFTFFDWLTAVDQTDQSEESGGAGFDIVCHLIDPSTGGGGPLKRVLLRTRVPLDASVDASFDASLASATAVWRGAAWHERETHEMFGIDFPGFDDGTGQGLRPLLLPDGFEGTPLRKSFVLAARVSKAWPGAKEPGEGGESGAHAARTGPPSRRKVAPPGIPDPSWGPR